MNNNSRKTVIDNRYNNYKIADLTRLGMTTEPDTAAEDNSFPLCTHCEIGMTRCKNGFFCKECGLVKEDNATDATATVKKRESVGPRIPKKQVGNSSILFKSIRYTPARSSNHKPTFLELDDEMTEELLKAQGCIIGVAEERIT